MDIAALMSQGKGKFGKARLSSSKGRPMPPMPPSIPEEQEESSEADVLGQLREHLQSALDIIDEYLGGGEEAELPELPMGE